MKRLILAAATLLSCCLSSSAFSCSISDIEIKFSKLEPVNRCRASVCMRMEGVATLRNRCSEAIGVQIQVILKDKDGNPLSSDEFWPASVSNIAPGDFTFSLDGLIDYKEGIDSYTIAPIRVTKWGR